MSYEPAAKLRQRFNSQSAREAFDRINAMGPKWTFNQEDNGRIFISPSIESKTIGGGLLRSIGGNSGDDADELIRRCEDNLINTASYRNTLLVINAAGDDRREYRYDTAQKDFVLYSGTIDSGKPFSIKLKKPGS